MEINNNDASRAGLVFVAFIGLVILGVAGFLGWTLYVYYISKTSKAAFVDESRQRVYLKDNGTVVGKEVDNGDYRLIFTYPSESGTYRGVRQVSKSEYESSKAGDKFMIYYNPADPEEWMLSSSGKMGWGIFALVVGFIVTFLVGTMVVAGALRTYLKNR